MSKSDSIASSKKIRSIYFLFFFLTFALVLACVRWQVVKATEFKKIAEGRVYTSEIDSLRGSIYAKDGSTLAYSEPRFDMNLWMKDISHFETLNIQTREELVQKIAPIIDTTPEQLNKLIDSFLVPEDGSAPIYWIPVAKSLTASQWEQLTSLKTDRNPNRPLQGFSFKYTSKRIYPENFMGSHIIGLTNEHKDSIFGVGGIEQYWNGDLNPRKGVSVKESDAIGQAVASSLVATIEPQPGSSIYTSIDKKLQSIVEAELKTGAERFQAKSATAIVMDPKTGEIMALANYPTYNPNLRDIEDASVYSNIAISAPYEVGSVGKVITMATALDLGVIEPDTIIMPNGHDGCVEFTDELDALCTWDRKPQPPMPAWECLMRSDNICFFEISKMIEKADFHDYLTKSGVGQNTGIDISGESIGFLRDSSEWNISDVAAFSYGHGYLVNAVQTISAISVVPNKGIRMKPHIVTKVIKGDGEERDFSAEALNDKQRVVDEQTAETVGEILHTTYLNDIKDYEYWYEDLKNYKIGMKSGTALIANAYGYTSEINATQVGFDMSPERKFIMLVRLEEPQEGDLSFYNSRILWLDMFSKIKDHLQVPRK